MSNSLQQAHEDLYAALNDMLAGDAEPILAVWSESDDVSYGGPFGEFDHGRAAIENEFQQVAQRKLQGELVVDNVHVVEGSDLGYTTCMEFGNNHVIDGEVVNLKQRATNIFRKESGGWKLIHHHTDSSATN
jgi:ketosteroid isomerase-like protein